MHSRIEEYRKEDFDLIEVCFGKGSLSDLEMVDLIDHVFELVRYRRKPFGLVYDVERYKPTPYVKTYAKKLSRHLESNRYCVGTMVVNADMFTKILFSVLRKDIQFASSKVEAFEVLSNSYSAVV